MAIPDPTPAPKGASLGAKMMSVKRQWLYLLLIVCTTVPAFISVPVPNKPVQASMDFYRMVMSIPEGSTILIESDWTKSTRGESMGEMEALLRILMRRNIKFAVYATADPQAPQVARDTIEKVSRERAAAGQRPYERWNDWVSLGFFPNSEGMNNAIATDLRKAFAGRTESPGPGMPQTDVFQSPVLKNVQKVGDIPMLLVVTASKTFDIIVERLYGKVTLGAMVTGVMGPESIVYYSSGQMKGICVGLKGVYDLETMMESGINTPGPDGKIVVADDKNKEPVPGFPGQTNAGKGKAYYPTLHVALTLMILAIVIGNIGMYLNRKEAK